MWVVVIVGRVGFVFTSLGADIVIAAVIAKVYSSIKQGSNSSDDTDANRQK